MLEKLYNNSEGCVRVNGKDSAGSQSTAGSDRAVWPLQTYSVSHKTKLRIYNAAVFPVPLYGAESWPLNNSLAERSDGFDSRALSTIENIRWHYHVTNTELRDRTHQPPTSRLATQHHI